MPHEFDASGFVMRVRRLADLSQRDLATRLGISQALVSQVEKGRRDLRLETFSRLLTLAGLRLAVLDSASNEVSPTPADPIRDNAGRRLPVHLDVANSQPWWRYNHPHYHRDRPVVPFLMRRLRDEQRAKDGLDPDQLTATELWAERAAADAERAAQRAAERLATLAAATPYPDCRCPDACSEGDWCVSPCACQCEADPKGPAAAHFKEEWAARWTA